MHIDSNRGARFRNDATRRDATGAFQATHRIARLAQHAAARPIDRVQIDASSFSRFYVIAGRVPSRTYVRIPTGTYDALRRARAENRRACVHTPGIDAHIDYYTTIYDDVPAGGIVLSKQGRHTHVRPALELAVAERYTYAKSCREVRACADVLAPRRAVSSIFCDAMARMMMMIDHRE